MLFAAALASSALATSGCGSKDKPASTRPATTPAVATATTPVPTATTPPASTTADPAATKTTPSSSGSVIAGSSNGKVYRCIGPSLLHDLRAMSRRIERGRKSLKRIRAELRRLKRRYPNKVAPAMVAQRYNYLVRKHNALLALGNRRVHAYNGRLNRDCIHR
jgi:hypothetical protein